MHFLTISPAPLFSSPLLSPSLPSASSPPSSSSFPIFPFSPPLPSSSFLFPFSFPSPLPPPLSFSSSLPLFLLFPPLPPPSSPFPSFSSLFLPFPFLPPFFSSLSSPLFFPSLPSFSSPLPSLSLPSSSFFPSSFPFFRNIFYASPTSLPVEFIRTLSAATRSCPRCRASRTVSAVALELRFSTPSYFAKMFQQAFSVSPSASQNFNPLTLSPPTRVHQPSATPLAILPVDLAEYSFLISVCFL